MRSAQDGVAPRPRASYRRAMFFLQIYICILSASVVTTPQVIEGLAGAPRASLSLSIVQLLWSLRCRMLQVIQDQQKAESQRSRTKLQASLGMSRGFLQPRFSFQLPSWFLQILDASSVSHRAYPTLRIGYTDTHRLLCWLHNTNIGWLMLVVACSNITLLWG